MKQWEKKQTGTDSAMDAVADTLKGLRFRKRLLGGVDEADVWRQLEHLQQVYQMVHHQQAAYYQALLDEREQTIRRLLAQRGGGAGG